MKKLQDLTLTSFQVLVEILFNSFGYYAIKPLYSTCKLFKEMMDELGFGPFSCLGTSSVFFKDKKLIKYLVKNRKLKQLRTLYITNEFFYKLNPSNETSPFLSTLVINFNKTVDTFFMEFLINEWNKIKEKSKKFRYLMCTEILVDKIHSPIDLALILRNFGVLDRMHDSGMNLLSKVGKNLDFLMHPLNLDMFVYFLKKLTGSSTAPLSTTSLFSGTGASLQSGTGTSTSFLSSPASTNRLSSTSADYQVFLETETEKVAVDVLFLLEKGFKPDSSNFVHLFSGKSASVDELIKKYKQLNRAIEIGSISVFSGFVDSLLWNQRLLLYYLQKCAHHNFINGFKQLLKKGATIEFNHHQCSMFTDALSNGNFEIANAIIEQIPWLRKDMQIMDIYLIDAVRNSLPQVADWFLSKGAPFYKTTINDLMFKSTLNRKSCLPVILKYKPDVNLKKNGITILEKCCVERRVSDALLVLQSGAQISLCRNSKYPPIHYAIISGSEELIYAFIERGADAKEIYPNGYSALIDAVLTKDKHISSIFLNNVPIDYADFNKQTALIHAAKTRNHELVNILVQNGAKTTKDKFGKTFSDYFD